MELLDCSVGDIIEPGRPMTLAIFTLVLVILFFVALRQGLLDELPRLFGRRAKPEDPDQTRRLEIFRQYIDPDSENDE